MRTLPKKILVPVDFSAGARQALDYASMLAGQLPGSEIILMHAIEPMVFPVKPQGGTGLPDRNGWREEVEAKLDTLAKRAKTASRRRVRTIVRSGRAYQEIARAAASSKADLIVLGSAGYGAQTYSRFGTTAERVARKSPCAVLLVRDKADD